MIQRAISVSKAFGKVVVTVHGDVDGPLLGRTLADLAEDPGHLHLIVNLRDADSLDEDSLNVLSRSARTYNAPAETLSSRLARPPFLTPFEAVSSLWQDRAWFHPYPGGSSRGQRPETARSGT